MSVLANMLAPPTPESFDLPLLELEASYGLAAASLRGRIKGSKISGKMGRLGGP